MSNTIAIEVAYALPDKQRIIKLDVPEGTTVMQAVILSRMDSIFEDLTLSDDLKLGVWGKAVTTDRALAAGERVEIYRNLLADPKEVRRARAARAKAARSESSESQDAPETSSVEASSVDGA